MSAPVETALPWYRTINSTQWKALWAAMLGWMLDAMDFVIFLMAIGTLQDKFDFDNDTAGLLGTATLLVSAGGGLLFGVVADRIGRTRALMATILIFSLCSLGTATAQNLIQLAIWRGLLGIGMGGEWASGSTLISETWPAQHRGKAISIMQSGWALGYIAAAALAALFLDILPLGEHGWRWLFAFGALPALLIVWVRREVEEPNVWKEKQAQPADRPNPFQVLFSPAYRGRTIFAMLLTSSVLFAYWGLFFWIPSFLAKDAGMSLSTSLGWIVPTQLGAFFGYLSFGFLAERFGRRATFIAFVLAAAVLVPIYASMARDVTVLFVLGPLLGFVGHGYFSVFGAMLAELFPTEVRATGQGMTYNCGRAFGALAPYVIGLLAKQYTIGSGLALTSAFFVLGAVLIFFLPDTSKQELAK